MNSPNASAATASTILPRPSAPITAPRILRGLHEIAADYDAFLIDLWGVTHDGGAPYPDALAALRALRMAGKKLAFVSNSSSVADKVASHLCAMGIADYDALITSGALVAEALRQPEKFCRSGHAAKALLAGDSGIAAQYRAPIVLTEQAAEAGFILNVWYGDDADSLAAMAPRLREWRLLDLPMICCNPDHDVLLSGGRLPSKRLLCPGALAAAYAALGGKVHGFGKPYREAFAAGVAALNLPATARIAMIGDNMLTDIIGGLDFGIDTILVQSGVHRDALGIAWGGQAAPQALQRLCGRHGYAPHYALSHLTY